MNTKLIAEARHIIDGHHFLGLGGGVAESVGELQLKAMRLVGFDETSHTEKQWDEYLDLLPEDVRDVMIELDDALEMHRYC